jgi:glucose/arabinose dehydrogenase
MEAKMRLSAMAAAAAASLLGVMSGPILAQQSGNAQRAHSPAQSFDPASLPDQTLGQRFTIKPEDMPPPMTGPVVAARPLSLPYQGQTIRVPEGFTAAPFATGLTHPRRLLVLPNGDVIVAEQRAGYLTLLRDADGDGKAEWIQRRAEGFNGPYGLAWQGGAVARCRLEWPCTMPNTPFAVIISSPTTRGDGLRCSGGTSAALRCTEAGPGRKASRRCGTFQMLSWSATSTAPPCQAKP